MEKGIELFNVLYVMLCLVLLLMCSLKNGFLFVNQQLHCLSRIKRTKGCMYKGCESAINKALD